MYDKTGLLGFGRALSNLGWELVASGGTAQLLASHGLTVRDVSAVTGFPEMLGGRVKTLHPAIHGGILARDLPEDDDDLAANNIRPFDLVVCNLYPFQETVAKEGVTLAEAVEQIDIGGVTLLRAAAKNFDRVTVVCNPIDYGLVLKQLRDEGQIDAATRQALAVKAFQHTRDYDIAIADYLANLTAEPTAGLPQSYALNLVQTQALRYGENPHQRAGLYATSATHGPLGGKLLQGKALSYNNLLDLDAAWRAAESFKEPAVVIVKHLSPCGIAVADSPAEAFPAALASDPVSAFGGVIAVNRPVDMAFADQIREAKLFVEAIVAPSFAEDAQTYFAEKKKNCRLVALGEVSPPGGLEMRSIRGGYLIQDLDVGDPDTAEWRVVTERQPTAEEEQSLKMAWQAVNHVKSNAIVFAKGNATIGVGCGLPSRIDAVDLAAKKAGETAQGAAMASDAFFPFPDGIEAAAQAGITAVVQPGGSVRDDVVIEAANKLGLTMIFTGTRHFRH